MKKTFPAMQCNCRSDWQKSVLTRLPSRRQNPNMPHDFSVPFFGDCESWDGKSQNWIESRESKACSDVIILEKMKKH